NFAQNQAFSPAAKLAGDSKPGWRVLRVLANMLNVDGFDYDNIGQVSAAIKHIKVHPGHINLDCSINEQSASAFTLFNEVGIYDVDMLTRRSAPLQDTVHASTDNLSMHSEDAKTLGLENAMTVIVNQQFGDDSMQVALFVKIDDNIPRGSVQAYKCVGLRSDKLNVSLTVGDTI
ncbi:MAG TPA: hypothetical protein ENJ41_07715, partial [Oceanospirillales bacterium]|nr:hypothetical protein [Oceanospirillales bacterium]